MTQDEINLIAYSRSGGRSVEGYFRDILKQTIKHKKMTEEALKRAIDIKKELTELQDVVRACTSWADGRVSILVSAGGEGHECFPIILSQNIFSQSEIKERALSRISQLQKELDNL